MPQTASNLESLLDTTVLPRIWLKAFWGFNPQEAGYVGFTEEWARSRFITNAKPKDLVLIYGTASKPTLKTQQAQMLGFLEIDPIPIEAHSKISDSALAIKIKNKLEHKWRYAVPVRRAWQITRSKCGVAHFAPTTYYKHNHQHLAARGELLLPEEVQQVLKFEVQQLNVYGEAPISGQNTPMPLERFFKPSRGLKTSFGERSSNYEDGEHYLYVMIARGDVAAFLGKTVEETNGKILVKVGYSNDPAARESQINFGIPPKAAFRWKLDRKSQPFLDGESARSAEEALMLKMDACTESQGGEYFFGNEEVIFQTFSDSLPKLMGGYQKRQK